MNEYDLKALMNAAENAFITCQSSTWEIEDGKFITVYPDGRVEVD